MSTVNMITEDSSKMLLTFCHYRCDISYYSKLNLVPPRTRVLLPNSRYFRQSVKIFRYSDI